MNLTTMPDGLELVRTTDVFDQDSVPAGLLRAHRVADGVWGRLVVHSGAVTFVFDDEPTARSSSAPVERSRSRPPGSTTSSSTARRRSPSSSTGCPTPRRHALAPRALPSSPIADALVDVAHGA